MIALDTSVVVAAFATWHEGHASARAALARGPRLPAHVLVEAFSVLTRLPPPHRASADLVEAFLRASFKEPPLTLRPDSYRELLQGALRAGITGGTLYDALVAATAREAGATLVTRDRRAAPTYEALAVRFELLD